MVSDASADALPVWIERVLGHPPIDPDLFVRALTHSSRTDAHGEGNYEADDETIARLEGEGRVVARYLEHNPNGSLCDIAGITNERGNVVGLMPHPEHCVEEGFGPSTDGLAFFTSAIKALANV